VQFLYFQDGEGLKIDYDKCTGCGMCLEVCPHNVFKIENKKANAFRKEYCMECGACGMNCPAGAIDVKSGVGCASAIIRGFLKKSDPVCGCSEVNDNNGCACG
jgi:NAD-dependent dihydropyrimidine dehydrogenase PreA subunit